MSILYPAFLWLLVPLTILFYYREKKAMETVHLVIVILLVLALSRPVLKQGEEVQPIEGKTFIVAIDASYSMRAKDVKPDRYTFAKETIHALLTLNPSDNIMLIAFTTNPLLLSPPTTDHQLIALALKSFNLEYILTKGTSLERLFKKVASMKGSQKGSQKNLILLTDGGEEKDVEALSKVVNDASISLTVLALGSRQGTTIEKSDGSLLKDPSKNLVVSRVNPMLEELSSQTKGTYFTASSTPTATAQAIYTALQEQDKTRKLSVKKQQHYTELYQLPLLLAVLLFMMLHTRGVKYLLLIFTLLGIDTQASMLDTYYLNEAYKSYHVNDYNRSSQYLTQITTPSLQSHFALGNTYYKQGDYKKALSSYLSIRSTSPTLKQKLYYNIANTYVKQEAYKKAKVYYVKALQLGDDNDSRANLNLVMFLLKKKEASLGIAHPKSQSSDNSKSSKKESENKKEESRSEDEPSSSQGDGGEQQHNKKQEKSKLIQDTQQEEKHPLSSKVYELINRGYIHEETPW